MTLTPGQTAERSATLTVEHVRISPVSIGDTITAVATILSVHREAWCYTARPPA